MAITQRFRRIWRFLTPPWLQEDDGDEVLYALGELTDAFVQRVRDGLEVRFPSRASESAITLIGGDRGLLRGRDESKADYALRLIAWRTPRTHRVRGNAYEALQQIWHYWGGIPCATVDAHGLMHELDVDGVSSRSLLGDWVDGDLTAWDNVDADANWSRFWVMLLPGAEFNITETPDFGDPDLWGGALGTPGYTLGQTNVTPEDVSAMRSLFQDLNWHPGNTIPEWLVIPTYADAVPEDIIPDGEWQYWSKDNAGTRVASRDDSFRYWSLSPLHNNTYAGIRTRPWPAAATNVDESGDFEGDRSNAAAWDAFTLPGLDSEGQVVTYAGDRTQFPTDILLLDDGTFPR